MLINILILTVCTMFAVAQHTIVVIIPSYNNAQWYAGNLDSLFQQSYKNWRAIYIDDCSSDKTGDLAEHYIKIKGFSKKIQIIKNKTRKKALANITNAIRSCKDHELIVLLDGDDKLAHIDALSFINKFYNKNDVWLTYGNFQWRTTKKTWDWVKAYAQETITTNKFREATTTIPSHLRTFFAGLFKKIKDKDLRINGEYFDMAWDLAIMLPMLEMAGVHSAFISTVLYDYNDQNSISDYRINLTRQLILNKHIRSMSKYMALQNPPFDQGKVA